MLEERVRGPARLFDAIYLRRHHSPTALGNDASISRPASLATADQGVTGQQKSSQM